MPNPLLITKLKLLALKLSQLLLDLWIVRVIKQNLLEIFSAHGLLAHEGIGSSALE